MPVLDFTDQSVAALDFSAQSEPSNLPDFSAQSEASSDHQTKREKLLAERKQVEETYTPIQPESQTLKEFFAAQVKPLVEIQKPEAPADAGFIQKAATGLARSAIGAAESITAPATAELIAASAIPVVGKPLVAAVGAGIGTSTAISGANEFSQAVQRGDVQGAAEAAGNMILGYGLIGSGLKGIVKGEVPVVSAKLAPVTAKAFQETVGETETFRATPPPLPSTEVAKAPEVNLAPITSAVVDPVEVPKPAEEAPVSISDSGPVPKQAVITELPVPAAESDALGISATAHPALRAIAGLFNPGGITKAVDTVKDFFGAYAGKSMPKTTRADQLSGELGARMDASRQAAAPLANLFSDSVLSGTNIDPKKFGTALTEDNLRSVKEGFIADGDPQAASKVQSVIGSKGSPFQTEADYQAFLNEPETQAAIARHKQLWEAHVDPMYKQAMSIDPNEVLPERGAQTGARINLFADSGAGANAVHGVGQGNLLATLKRKSPFGIKAKGTGQAYNGNYYEIMRNTFGRQLRIANKNAFDTRLVESGNAVIDKPGQHPILDDEPTIAFPYVRQRVIIPGEPTKVAPQNRSIYVKQSLAKEYSRVSGTETRMTGPPAMKMLTDLINQSSLAGFTEGTVHLTNLATVLLTRPAVAGKWWADAAMSAGLRSDAVVTGGKAILKAFQDNSKQIAELTEIAAMREPAQPRSKFHPMGWMSDLIHKADQTVRLVMDDTFHNLVRDGLIENTETNRREWVNQVGQYSKGLQGKWTAAARDSGLSPFITAGKTFTTLGARNLTLSPGVKATGIPSAAALRANIAAKWIGLGTLAGTLNFVFTHKLPGGGMQGRPGTPLGDVDSGKDDENGRPLVFPLANLLGLGRGLRISGIRGYTEAKRKGLPSRVAMDAAIRDIINSQAGMLAGPPVRLAFEAATGFPPAINVGRATPVVPPGESQSLANIKGALVEANPIVSSIAASQEPGGTALSGIQKQFPRFSLAPRQTQETIEKYPEIVRKAQAAGYIDDVIRKARKMAPNVRMDYLRESVSKLDPEDQKNAWQQFKRRRVMQ